MAVDFRSLLARLPIKHFQDAPIVAVLPLTGVIGGGSALRQGLSLAALAEAIDRAFKLPRLKAVALEINSPGGSPVQSALIAKRIRDLAGEKEVPVYAFAEDVAASGGYWLACAADEIFAHESSILGSIGVIYAGFGFQDALKRLGVERRVHTAGERKSMLDPFRVEVPEEVERLRAVQTEIHETFKAMVRNRRGERLKSGDDALFTGEFWTGRRALELGLIDGLGDLRGIMRERYGEKVQLRKIGGAKPWWRRRFGLSVPTFGDQDWAPSLIATLEERELWARYGL